MEARKIVTKPNNISNGQKVIILGAQSAIAEASARLWAKQGASLLLAGRESKKLEQIANDLRIRGADTLIYSSDLVEVDIDQSLKQMVEKLGGVDVVLLAYGVLGNQKEAEKNITIADNIFNSNFNSAAKWCLAVSSVLEAQKRGRLIVLGSVAGDRGRSSNYIYGATKAGIGILTQGIAHRLAKSGALALLVKPGFVDTPMTANFTKGLLWSKPSLIARKIVKFASSNTKATIIYAPWYWRFIMIVIRLLPSKIMHMTKL